MMIKAVVFDIDNTLYDYDTCNKKAMECLLEYACEQYNISKQQFETFFENARTSVKEQLGDTAAAHNRMLYMQRFLEGMGYKPVMGALDLYNVYWECMLQNMVLYPYVIPLLNELKHREIKIALLTDLTAHIQHRKIMCLGLESYVDALVTSEEAGKEKPAKEAFALIMNKVGVAYDEMLIIGDDSKKDIKGAENVGMHGILFRKELSNSMDSICMNYILDEAVQKDI